MNIFKHTMTINKTELIFCFSKIVGSTADKYSVEVMQGERMVTAFDIVNYETNRWKILPPAREWVIELEDKLTNVMWPMYTKEIYQHRRIRESNFVAKTNDASKTLSNETL